jgi:hypothetical protein
MKSPDLAEPTVGYCRPPGDVPERARFQRRIQISMNTSAPTSSRIICRSARNGEMNQHITINPAFHQLRYRANPPDILHPIGFSKAEILVATQPNIVVEQGRVNATRMQSRLDEIGES